MVGITRPDDFRRQYEQQPQPNMNDQIMVTFYGYPVTVDRVVGRSAGYRVACWGEGEQNRTKPLVEQRFGYDEFHEAVRAAALKADPRITPYGTSMTESFIVEWALQNRHTIEDAADRRRGNPVSFTDLGKLDAPIPTRTFQGEDGRTYTELDLRGEDTDPVLLNASANREQILAQQEEERRRIQVEKERIRQEGLRRLKEAEERREREQEALERMPGWGSF